MGKCDIRKTSTSYGLYIHNEKHIVWNCLLHVQINPYIHTHIITQKLTYLIEDTHGIFLHIEENCQSSQHTVNHSYNSTTLE